MLVLGKLRLSGVAGRFTAVVDSNFGQWRSDTQKLTQLADAILGGIDSTNKVLDRLEADKTELRNAQ